MDSALEANSLTVLGACQFCDNQTTRELLFLGYLPPVNSLKIPFTVEITKCLILNSTSECVGSIAQVVLTNVDIVFSFF